MSAALVRAYILMPAACPLSDAERLDIRMVATMLRNGGDSLISDALAAAQHEVAASDTMLAEAAATSAEPAAANDVPSGEELGAAARPSAGSARSRKRRPSSDDAPERPRVA